jgi:hypothetical protein
LQQASYIACLAILTALTLAQNVQVIRQRGTDSSSSSNSSPTNGKHVDEYAPSTVTNTTAASAATAGSTPRGLRPRSSRWHLTSEANLLTSIAALNIAAVVSAVACASAGSHRQIAE